MFMGDHALWAVGMRGTLASGPETRSDETTELRYYWRPQPKEYETLVIVDGTFRSDLRASFTASFKHPRDWIPDELWARRLKDDEPPAIEDARLIRDRPYVGFFLGGRDVRRPYLNLSEAEKKAGARNRPFTGLMVQIAGDVIRLAQIRGKGATPRDRIRHFETKVLKEHRLKASGQKLKVGVKVQPKKSVVIVTVNGTPYRFKTDALRPGLYGFHLSKAGYVGIRDLKVR
jgi:hypothetical protein